VAKVVNGRSPEQVPGAFRELIITHLWALAFRREARMLLQRAERSEPVCTGRSLVSEMERSRLKATPDIGPGIVCRRSPFVYFVA